jgi:hypothetical protein
MIVEFSFPTSDWTKYLMVLPSDIRLQVIISDPQITTIETELLTLSKILIIWNERKNEDRESKYRGSLERASS